MAKMNFTRFLSRVSFNVIVAAIILSLIGGFITGFTGGIASSVIAIAAVWIAFTVMKMRPGNESLLTLVLGIPAGVAVVNILTTIIGVSVPVIGVSDGIFSLGFLLVITSYFAADLLFINFFRKR